MRIMMGAVLGFAITAAPLFAGQEPAQDKEKEKQKQEEPKQKQEEPKQKQEEPRKQEPQPKADKQQPEPSKQQKAEEKQQQQQKETDRQSKDSEKKQRDNNPQPQQNMQQSNRAQPSAEASHGRGERIPSQKFQRSFGREHHFRVRHVDDGRRFQYGGYWFEVAEVWPSDWSYDDDYYIEEDADDYYLVDSFHPGARVLVIVVQS